MITPKNKMNAPLKGAADLIMLFLITEKKFSKSWTPVDKHGRYRIKAVRNTKLNKGMKNNSLISKSYEKLMYSDLWPPKSREYYFSIDDLL